MSIELWLGTTNSGKINEFRNLFAGHPVQIKAASDLKVYSAPPETGSTFLENARIKAKVMKSLRPGLWVLADDSGLEVEGLGNMPGIHSARYAGPNASDAENISKLMKMVQIRTAMNRKARFVCCLVAYDPNGNEHVFQETLDGSISQKVQGKGGFGYDPIFIPEGESKTLAELPIATKNKISHRGKALRQLRTLILAPA